MSEAKMYSNNGRLDDIIVKLKEKGVCSQSELAAFYKVSVQTIRRDFALLKERNIAKVKAGVAFLEQGINDVARNTDYSTRQSLNYHEKELIAHTIADQIEDGMNIFLTVGTTNEQIAAALRGKNNLTIITSSIRVADALTGLNESNQILIPPGRVLHSNGAIVGTQVHDFISKFYVDRLITSVGAFSSEGMALEFNLEDVATANVVMKNCHKIIVAADHSKFNARASVVLCHPKNIDEIYSDQEAPKELMQIFNDNNVKFTVCK